MAADGVSTDSLEELKEANTRLQRLVSELLLTNQELRTQLSTEIAQQSAHEVSPKR